jgi:carbonic anhydrase/acetyltransferase-like protein (isoleucine patch superfamily)
MTKSIYPYDGAFPKIGERVLIAPGAVIIGNVTLGDDCSIFPNVVLRGDINTITVGKRTNIQDNTTVHLADKYGVILGDDVTVGHNAVIHACTIEDGCIIGMGAIIMDGAIIHKNCIVGAGALVTGGSEFPEGSMIFGTPAKVVRPLKPAELESTIHSAHKYVTVKDKLIQSLS